MQRYEKKNYQAGAGTNGKLSFQYLTRQGGFRSGPVAGHANGRTARHFPPVRNRREED